MNASPPVDMQAPGILSAVFYLLFAVQLVPAVGWMISRYRRTKDPVPLGALIGATTAGYFSPPVLNYLTMVWFPSNIPFPFIHAFGMNDPSFDWAGYVLFFGFGGYLVHLWITRGGGKKAVVVTACLFGLADLLYELPFLHWGFYCYYGDQPFTVGGFPVHWAFMNASVPVCTGAIIHLLTSGIQSPKAAFARAALAPVLACAVLFIPVLPISVMLHADVPHIARAAGALLSIAIALATLGIVRTYSARVAAQPAAQGAGQKSLDPRVAESRA